jgi:hypothetical protein
MKIDWMGMAIAFGIAVVAVIVVGRVQMLRSFATL